MQHLVDEATAASEAAACTAEEQWFRVPRGLGVLGFRTFREALGASKCGYLQG